VELQPVALDDRVVRGLDMLKVKSVPPSCCLG
jgi:hypothetical protein